MNGLRTIPVLKIRSALAILLAVFTVRVYSQEIPQLDTLTLNNGLKVYLLPWGNDSLLHVRLVINGGKKNENECQVGYSDMIQLLLNQSLKEKQNPHLRSLHPATCKISEGQTVVSGNCSQGHFAAQMELFSTAVARLSFTKNKMDAIVAALIERYKPERMSEAALAAIYRNKVLYGARHPLGRSYCQYQLEKVLPEQLRDFYTGQYLPQRSSLLICGNFNSYAVKRAVTKHFIKWRLLHTAEETPDIKPPEIKDKEITFINKRDSKHCLFKWVLPAPSFTSADQLAFAAACKWFDDCLKRCIAGKSGLNDSILNFKAAVYTNGVMEVNSVFSHNEMFSAIQRFDSLLQNFRQLRCTPEELEGIVKSLESDYRIKSKTSKGILSVYDPLMYRFDARSNYMNDLQRIRLQHIEKMQQGYFHAGLYRLIIVGQEHLVSNQLNLLKHVAQFQAADFETCEEGCKEVVILKCHCQSCYERGQCRIWRFDPSQKEAIKSARSRAGQALK